ncbi:MAG TPA: DUF4147 domain-containing protein, partial [Anaerolineales bacterium]|nr:DUF4147 domain-containing protein [Anaerolineales bacterium]
MSRDRLATVNLRDARLIRILEAALQSVEPAHLVADYLRNTGLPPHSRCFMLGMGKAAEAMTHGAAEIIRDFEAALVITKQSTSASTPRFTILEAGHPIPDERSLAAGQAVLDFVAHLQPEDLLLCLIS